MNRISPTRDSADAQQIFLVDHGRHPSLILPMEDGLWVRYAYGDWDWYALGVHGALSAVSAMCWPTKSGLGRRIISKNDELPNWRREIPEGYNDILPLMADKRKVRELVDELEQIFVNNENRSHYNQEYNLVFVPHPRSYWFAHESNQVMAAWLRKLDFEVTGFVVFSNWKVE